MYKFRISKIIKVQ